VRGDRVTVKKEFLEVLRNKCSVYHAAKQVGVSRKTVYQWRHQDLEFASEWESTIEDAVDTVESSLYERALAGDTTATIFFLKGNRAKYRDRVQIDVQQLDTSIERELALLTAGGETDPSGEAEGETIN
jgi:hypothetical protein